MGEDWVGRVLRELAALGLGGAVDDVAEGVHEADEDQVVPGHLGAAVEQVAGDQGGQEGEGEVGGDQGPAES